MFTLLIVKKEKKLSQENGMAMTQLGFFMIEFVCALFIGAIGIRALTHLHVVTTQQLHVIQDLRNALEMILQGEKLGGDNHNRTRERYRVEKRSVPCLCTIKPHEQSLPVLVTRMQGERVTIFRDDYIKPIISVLFLQPELKEFE